MTRIDGSSAAGKSHLCMSLALAAQVPALSKRPGGAIILTSERELSTDRLVQLGKTLLAAHDPTRRLREKDLLDNIHTSLCKDIEALDHALSFVLPALLRSRQPSDTSPLLGQRPSFTGARPIRLLVLDSITALLRGDTAFTSTSIGLTQRSRYLCIVTDRLKALALEYSLAVVVINQVSDVFARPQATPSPSTSFALSQFYNDGPEPPMLYATQARWFSGQSETLQKEASLGIVWANAINTRVMLSRTGRRRKLNQDDLSRVKRKRRRGDDDDKDETGFGPVVEDHKPTLVRRMHLVFSPFASPGTVDYVISPSGVHSLPDTYKLEDISETVKRQAKKTRLARLVQDIEDGNVSEEGGSQRVREESEDEGGREGEDDEFGGEVFDDLGDLPAEFWEGNFEAVGEEALAQGVAL